MTPLTPPISIVLLGMPCAASAPPLAALLDAGHAVRAVILGGRGDLDDAAATSVARLAAAAGIPVRYERRMGPEVTAAIARWRPDAVVIACFPWKLPPAVMALPPLGCLNVHPSLLPVGRGPEPVFWTLRRGERQTGVTVHLLDAGFDTGPIVVQATIDVPIGVRAPDFETRLMTRGGQLLVAALPRLAAGILIPTPQDDAAATLAPVPTAADFVVPTNLPARWAYAFTRGVAPLGGPLVVSAGATGQRFPVRDALAYAEDESVAVPVAREGNGIVRVRFRPGWVRFRLAGGDDPAS